VATLIRRGKIREIKFPYNLGMMTNIRAVLGDNPLLWCWPQPMRGDGLRFRVAEGTGKWIQFYRSELDQNAGLDDLGSSGHYDAPPFAGGQPSVRAEGAQHDGRGWESLEAEMRARAGVPSSRDEVWERGDMV